MSERQASFFDESGDVNFDAVNGTPSREEPPDSIGKEPLSLRDAYNAGIAGVVLYLVRDGAMYKDKGLSPEEVKEKETELESIIEASGSPTFSEREEVLRKIAPAEVEPPVSEALERRRKRQVETARKKAAAQAWEQKQEEKRQRILDIYE